jgi:hypothetical protein
MQRYPAAIDTYISSEAPTKRLVDAKTMKVDRTPNMWSLLRFEGGEMGAGRRALLRLYAHDGSSQGGKVYAVAGGWDSQVTWDSRPVLGRLVADLGKVNAHTWITVDVSHALQGDRVIALAIVPESKDAVSYRTSESGSAHVPTLIIE